MKKLFLTFVAVVIMALSTYAGPPTKEYQDATKCLDKFEQNLNKAESCDDIYIAALTFLVDIYSFEDVEYADNERMTEEEEEKLDKRLEQLEKRMEALQKRWDCSFGDDDFPVEIDDDDVEEYILPDADDDVVDDEIFSIVEVMPEFPGGMSKLSEYLAQNIVYPVEARKAGIQGKVFVNFVVEPNGSVSNVKVMRSLGYGCDEEAIRVVKAMPRWTPGTQRGKAVRVSYNLPINFKLTD